MSLKIFEFKTIVCGFEKHFKVHGKDYNEARQKLDAHILKSVTIVYHKDITPNKDFSMDDMFKKFGEIFGGSGDIFGNKK